MNTPLQKYPDPLRKSVIEGMFNALLVGGAMIFVVPFAVLLGANSLQIGFLVALPALLAAWFQLGAIRILEFYNKKRQIVIFSVFVQAFSWLAIAILPFLFKSDYVTWLIALTTIGTVIGSFGIPFWQSWMRSLTPKEIIGEYFGIRNALIGFIIFATTLICGLLLEIVPQSELLYAFIAIFLLGFAGRIISGYLFTKIDEPFEEVPKTVHTNIFHYVSQLKKNNFGHFVLYGTFMMFSISLISPFIPVYFLDGLGLSNNYFMYTVLVSAAALTSLISLPYWGRVIDKYGTTKILRTTGLLVCFYPLGLFLIRDPIQLIILQLFDGVIFSSFTFALANFIYESFPSNKIIKYAAFQSVLFGTAAFCGTILSGYLQTLPIAIGILTTPFFVMCILSMLLRMIVFTSSVWKIKEPHKKEYVSEDAIIIKTITLEPISETLRGNLSVIITATEGTLVKFKDSAKRITAGRIKKVKIIPFTKRKK